MRVEDKSMHRIRLRLSGALIMRLWPLAILLLLAPKRKKEFRKMSTSRIIAKALIFATGLGLMSQTVEAQVPNKVWETWSFDVISDIGMGIACPSPSGCAQPVPYHLATLNLARPSAPDKRNVLTVNVPKVPNTDNGVVSWIVSEPDASNWPPVSGGTDITACDINVEPDGNDLSGTIQEQSSVTNMWIVSGVDGHWVGQYTDEIGGPIPVHHVVVTATRVP